MPCKALSILTPNRNITLSSTFPFQEVQPTHISLPSATMSMHHSSRLLPLPLVFLSRLVLRQLLLNVIIPPISKRPLSGIRQLFFPWLLALWKDGCRARDLRDPIWDLSDSWDGFAALYKLDYVQEFAGVRGGWRSGWYRLRGGCGFRDGHVGRVRRGGGRG